MSNVGSVNEQKKSNLVDNVVKTIEYVSLVLIALPYCGIGLSILLSFITRQDYFALFPYGLFTILPTGIFGLLIQLLRRLMKQPASMYSNIAIKAGVSTSIFGVLAYGLIYAVAG